MSGEMFGDRLRPTVLVLGLGESGLAIARWCARHGCRLRIADTREAPANLDALRAAGIDAEFVGGPFSPALLDGGIEVVALSPGLSPLEPELAALLDAARERGLAVWGELEFFARALRALGEHGYAPKVLAVTGTNGKTTTTRMTGLLCERAGMRVAVAGNISPSLLDRLAEAIDSNTLPDVWVLELSSFQLEGAQSFAPDAATILNLSQDHLDWHGSFEAYAAAKGKVFGADTVRVLNRDDAQVMQFAAVAGSAAPRVITFGLEAPVKPGDYGLLRDKGMNWLVLGYDRDAADEGAPVSTRRRKQAAAEPVDFALKHLMPADALRVRGLHNAANALAAFALARAAGLPAAPLLHALREYRGEPHRVELIASFDGVDYVDDSKGTNVGATVAALDGLAQHCVLIAGGDGKGQDFAPLAAPVTRWCRAVALIGRDTPALQEALAQTGVPLHAYASLEAAVRAASELAAPGDAVLLSPACASLDMFTNYAHRAQVFTQAVHEIALDKGTTL